MKCRLYWRVVRLTYPWLPLLILAWRALSTTGMRRDRTRLRLWLLLLRVDFGNLLAIAIEMAQPEYWA